MQIPRNLLYVQYALRARENYRAISHIVAPRRIWNKHTCAARRRHPIHCARGAMAGHGRACAASGSGSP
eukprot:6194384-Pleurochrysis_carterae.AAC.3